VSHSYTVAIKERDDSIATGVAYGVRHRISGRWYWKAGRFRDDPCPIFHGPHEALRVMRQYYRDSEIAFLELAPFQNEPPASSCEAEAAVLMEAGPQPLLPRDDYIKDTAP